MLVLEEPESLRLITQHDHARLACDLLTLWSADGFPKHHLRADLLLATAEHDSGWQGADAAPLLDPASGWPFDFRRYPESDRQTLWREAIARLADASPLRALLIIRHAERIHQDRVSSPSWEPFFTSLAAKRLSLEESHEVHSAELDEAYEHLWLGDAMSLGACGALGPSAIEWRNYRFSISLGRIAIRPFPYAGPTTLRVACRILPKRRYSRATDLAVALAEARWRHMPVRVETL